MKHIFILNPAAGKGKKLDRFSEKLSAFANEKGLSFELYDTKGKGDATDFVRGYCTENKDKPVRFYACGGDGTINEVVSGAVGFPYAEVAILPIGTGNDFVRMFGEKARFLDLEAQLAAEGRPFDVICRNDKYCVNMMNIGFDGEVAARAAKAKKWFPGKMAYIIGVAGEFFKMSKASFQLWMDGKDMGKRKVLLSLYANGHFCGGGFHAAPYADLHDGLLDVCFIRPVSRLTFLSLVGSYRKGTHLLSEKAQKYFEYYKCSELVLQFDKPQRVCIDGEIEVYRELKITALRDAVRIVLPKGAESTCEALPTSPYIKTTV